MQRYTNFIASTTATNSTLTVLSNASCVVYIAGTLGAATLYSDNGVTPLANPFLSSATGRIDFYAANGRYDVVVSKTGFLSVTISDIELDDLLAPSGSNSVGYLPAGTGAVASTVQTKLRESVSVKDFGATGDGVTDDTAAINLAITAVQAMATHSLHFPAGNYLISAPLTSITGSGWTIAGDGIYSTYITSSYNGDIFSSDVSSTAGYFHTYQDMTLQRNSGGTYSSTCGVRVKAGAASAVGLQYAFFSRLRFNNLYRGVVVETTSTYTFGGITNNVRHGFFTFLDLISAFSTDAMYECIVFEDGTGPHHTIMGGQIRGSNAAIRLGTPASVKGVGDIIVTGVHVVTAGVGIDIYGPTDVTAYDKNINITGCQLDNCTTATARLDLMQLFRILPNNGTATVGVILTNCSNYLVEDRIALTTQAVTMQGTLTSQAITLQSVLNTTTGSISDTNGTRYNQNVIARRSTNTDTVKIVGGSVSGNGASVELFGGAHGTFPNLALTLADQHILRDQASAIDFINAQVATKTIKIGDGAWNGYRMLLGAYQFWVDSSGRLRIKSSAPTSDTDGTVVGTQV